MRRTTTHDSRRPDGLLGAVVVDARGRDLRTEPDGGATVLGTARVKATIAYVPSREITAITVDPPVAGAERLVGVAASSGFRQVVDDALPGERATRSLRYQLLDDVPTVTLVSGYALQAGGERPPRAAVSLQHADLCAGWVTGGTILAGVEADGHPPVVTGPEAPPLDRPGDPLAWHDVDALASHAMRRWRRIDVWPAGGVVAVECFFRDSHVDAGGFETVVHEYTVHAEVDRTTMRFTRCDTTIGALPWIECPGAAVSSRRLVGSPTDGLRAWVRATFVGPPTCTHLNDTLRALEDLPALIDALPR